MEKNCLITHIADADGAFPIILSKLVFKDVDVFSCEPSEVDIILESVLEHHEDFEKIYIVDLNISENMAEKIDLDKKWKNKVFLFDHHQSNLYLNKYSFIQVVDEENGRKECGSTLFYKYLKEKWNTPILDNGCLKTMLEYVRQADTYDFIEEEKQNAFQFASLYSIYGREKYIEHFYEVILNHETFHFSEVEKTLIELEENRTKDYIEKKMQHVEFAQIMNYKVGIVFAEQKRSLLGHEMVEKLDIDVAVIIDVDRSISYRAYKENVDASIIANYYNGGGHKHACGSPLPKNLHKKICEYLFQDIKWKD